MGSETQQEHRPLPGSEQRWVFGEGTPIVSVFCRAVSLQQRYLPLSVATCDRAWAYVAELRRVPGMHEGKKGPLGPTVLLMLRTIDTF